MEIRTRRAPGITVLAILAFVWGVMTWLTGISHGGGGLAPVGAPVVRPAIFLVSHDLWTNIKFYVFVAVPLVVGVGVLRRKPWARVSYVVFAAGMICFFVFNAVRNVVDGEKLFTALGYLAPLSVSFSFSIWYFSRPEIKEHFHKPSC